MELTAVNWHDTPAQIRADLWRTPDGRKLMALARDDRNPTTIAKAGDHTEARALLKQWQDDPKADLPPIMIPPPR